MNISPPAVVDAARGIEPAEAARRLEEFGPNEIATKGQRGPWRTLLEQFRSVMALVLGVAAIAAVAAGDVRDAAAILVMLLLNVLLGFRQEYKAERAMAELARLAAPTVRVRRAGIAQTIPAREIVPGDVVLIESGNIVPADARLIEAWNLRTNEAALTGESQPVDKEVDSEIFLGTTVVYGRATAVVVRTGPRTELGRVAGLLKHVRRPPTQLEVTLDRAAKKLAWIAIGIVAVIFAAGAAHGEPLRELFLTAVSLAVAAVPEGLPTVLVVALAISSQRMLKRNALIRKLSAIETLGAVTVICTDKTGTLTENRMQVVRVYAGGQTVSLEHGGPADETLDTLLLCGLLANDAETDESDRWVGDPTEVALAEAASKRGFDQRTSRLRFRRIAELPFDSGRKRMSTMHRVEGEPPLFLDGAAYVSITKGALEEVLELAISIRTGNGDEPLTGSWRKRILEAQEAMADDGIRVLAVAFRRLNEQIPAEDLESDLVFAGLAGLFDPPRPEARAAIETCHRAGIRPIMITGDHPRTAASVARTLGIGGEVIHAGASGTNVTAAVMQTGIYARVTPENKLELVRALQAHGLTVAMTGDGVNDSLALAAADVGIAMGRQGTDVARESADVVLQDDNFATIVAAVEEGRVIDDNIRRFVRFILACNTGELLVMLLASLSGMPLALTPLQILWMNLVTDGLPALALGMEPAERGIMERPPRSSDDVLFGRATFVSILWIGLLIGVVAWLGGYTLWRQGDANWQTALFTVTTLSQLGLALASRSDREPLFSRGMKSNPLLLGATMTTFVLQIALIYVPVLRGIFGTRALDAKDMVWSFVLSAGVFCVVELHKSWSRRSPGSPKGDALSE